MGCVSLFFDRNTDMYFDSLGAECILQDVLNKIKEHQTKHI